LWRYLFSINVPRRRLHDIGVPPTLTDLVLSIFCLFGVRSPTWPYHRPSKKLDWRP